MNRQVIAFHTPLQASASWFVSSRLPLKYIPRKHADHRPNRELHCNDRYRAPIACQLPGGSSASPVVGGAKSGTVGNIVRPYLPGILLVTRNWAIAAFALFCALFVFIRRRHVRQLLAKPYTRPRLNAEIADFYDKRSMAWESVWGEHLHHGLYFGPNGKADNPKRGVQAQIQTMEELLLIGGLSSPVSLPPNPRILDIGCGVGGASRFLARKFPGAIVTGLTLSPIQAASSEKYNIAAGLDDRVSTIVCDALNSEFPDNSFDLVWSLESAEHMADKHRLISECMRILRPGGTLLMVAWCLRESSPPLQEHEQFAIRKIMYEYCLPRLAPPSEYATNMRRLGFRHVVQEDWTARAAPFWTEVALTAFWSPKGWNALTLYGWPLIRSALAMRHVMTAIRAGCFKLAAFSARKPIQSQVHEEAIKKAKLRNC